MGTACRTLLRGLPALVMAAWIDAPARSQELLLQVTGQGGWFGYPIARIGDVNGDGLPEFLVSARYQNPPGVHVLDGSGSLLYQINSQSNDINEGFGASISSAGDVDADGVEDVLIGAPFNRERGIWNGAAYLHSGADGSFLRRFLGSADDIRLGTAVGRAGDVDGDGVEDQIVGAPVADRNNKAGYAEGAAYVYSGATGSLLHTIWGPSNKTTYPLFGSAVCGVGDVNGDGRGDLLVGAWGDWDSNGFMTGSATLFSGLDGSVLHRSFGALADDHYGFALAGLGDIDFDGVPEYAVGAYQHSGKGDGYVRIYSGQMQSLIATLTGSTNDAYYDKFGISVAAAGDVDADGVVDVVVGTEPYHRDNEGGYYGQPYVRIYSGATLTPLYNLRREVSRVYTFFGVSVAGVGDLNGDGFGEIAVGAPFGPDDGTYRGEVVLYSGNDLWLAAEPPVVASGDSLTLSTRSGVAGAPVALFLVEVNGSPLVKALVLDFFPAGGEWDLNFVAPPGIAGLSFGLMSFSLESNGKPSASASETVVGK